MRPLLLHAHTRAITHLEFNREGDLLFTTSKDNFPMVWRVENGERIGTYDGHTGSVWYCSVNSKTTQLLTAGADTTVRLWDAKKGTQLACIYHQNPVRCVQFSHGDNLFLSVTDQVLGKPPHVLVHKVLPNPLDMEHASPILDILGPNEKMKINHAAWGPLNRSIFCCNEDATVRVYDVETGRQTGELRDHAKSVVQLQFDRQQLLFITASKDGTARLYDTKTLKLLKTYETGRPVNVATISPLKDHVILGGGQDVGDVTTTRVDNSQFKAVLFNIISCDEIGRIPGHFGPMHTAQFLPDGRGYASGAEDGYIRLYKFDASYFAEEPITTPTTSTASASASAAAPTALAAPAPTTTSAPTKTTKGKV